MAYANYRPAFYAPDMQHLLAIVIGVCQYKFMAYEQKGEEKE
jgi:hypothetical protein